MYELLFIIMFDNRNDLGEQWLDKRYPTIDQCRQSGWDKFTQHHQEIQSKYPNMTGFDIRCRRVNINDSIQPSETLQ